MQGTGLAGGGRFGKHIGSLRGNGPNVRTDRVGSNMKGHIHATKIVLSVLTPCTSPPQSHD